MENLANKDEMLVYLSAKGAKTSEIASALDLTPQTVRLKLADDRVQFEIKRLRYQLYGKDHKKRFQDILPYAMDVTEEILKSPSAKPQLRFAAAQEVMDRALGKPKQTVEHEGSLVRSLLEKLNSKPGQEIIDISPLSPDAIAPGTDLDNVETPQARVDSQVLGNPNYVTKMNSQENPNFQKVDDWMAKNL